MRHGVGSPQQSSDHRQPLWLWQEYSLEMELQESAEPRHSFESEPDQLQPSC